MRGGDNPAPAVVTFTTATGLPRGGRDASGVDRLSRPRRLGVATRAPFRSSAGPAAGSQPATAVPGVLVAGQLGPQRCRSVPRPDWMNTMWRAAALQLLVRLRLVPRPDLIGRTVARHPIHEELPEGELVLVQNGNPAQMGVSALSWRMRTEDSTFPVVEPKTALACSPRLARTAKRLTVGSPAQRLSMPLLDQPRRGFVGAPDNGPSRRNRTGVTNAALRAHTGSFSFTLNSISRHSGLPNP